MDLTGEEERKVLLDQLARPAAYDEGLVKRTHLFLFPHSPQKPSGALALRECKPSSSYNTLPLPRANDAFALVQATSTFLGGLDGKESIIASCAGEIAQMAMYALEQSLSHPKSTSRTGLVEVCKLRSNLCTRFLDVGLVSSPFL